MPAGWNTLRRGPPHTPHSVSEGSLNRWYTSTWVPQERQAYSYVGMEPIIGVALGRSPEPGTEVERPRGRPQRAPAVRPRLAPGPLGYTPLTRRGGSAP